MAHLLSALNEFLSGKKSLLFASHDFWHIFSDEQQWVTALQVPGTWYDKITVFKEYKLDHDSIFFPVDAHVQFRLLDFHAAS